jgi:exocyst complex component 2
MEIDKLVKTQSDYIARSLSGFWKIAKACMDGKYRKVRSSPVHLNKDADK